MSEWTTEDYERQEELDEMDALREAHTKLKDAVTELLTKSPLLKGCPHEGSITGELIKKVLEAME